MDPIRKKKHHKATKTRDLQGKYSNRSIRVREQTESSVVQDHTTSSKPRQRPKRSKT